MGLHRTCIIAACLLGLLLASGFTYPAYPAYPARTLERANGCRLPTRCGAADGGTGDGGGDGESKSSMERPLLDRVATTLFNLENARVTASSEVDERWARAATATTTTTSTTTATITAATATATTTPPPAGEWESRWRGQRLTRWPTASRQ